MGRRNTTGEADTLPLVLRLVTTARKLGPDSWARVKETLVAGLIGDLGRVVDASLSWTREGLKAEILGLVRSSGSGIEEVG